MKKIKVIILPQIGCNPQTDYWYVWLQKKLHKLGLQVVIQDLTYLNGQPPEVNKDSIVIGHSAGGVAGLRYVEKNIVFGLVIISVSHTPLGSIDRLHSGYYNKPWSWDAINKHTNWIVQFASQDDTLVNIEEPRFIHTQLNSEYHEYIDRGHFGSEYRKEETFPELVEVIKRKLSFS